jgi:glycerol-3-phosphate dehydrogenase (NAD(P)+)
MDSSFASQGVGIIGAGSWGTALGLLLAKNNLPVSIWGHDSTAIKRVADSRENHTYLPGIQIPPSIQFTDELDSLAHCGLILLVTPSRSIREVSARLSTIDLNPNAVLLSCTKGVERGSGETAGPIRGGASLSLLLALAAGVDLGGGGAAVRHLCAAGPA